MISERWLSDDTKVAILLQEEAEAYRQLGDIKGEETSWLRLFMLVFGAIVACGCVSATC